MSSVTTDPLEKLIRDSGEGWLIDWYRPREKAIAHLHAVLQRANNAAAKRLGDGADRF